MKLRHIIIIGVFVLINVLVFSTLNFGKDAEEEVEIKPFIQVLEATEVKNLEEQFQVSGYGTVSSFNAVDISCEVQGKLNKSRKELKPGVKFKKGEVLFRVDDTEARYNLRARMSSFINILAQLLPDIKIDFASEFDKWNDYVASIEVEKRLPELPKWKNNKEKIFLSTRNVISEYYSIRAMEEQLRKYTVYAPFSGMITEVYASDQTVVNPGTKVMKIAQTGNFEIAVSIPTHALGSINIGTEAKIYTTVGVQKGVGTVIRISEVINKSTQSVEVYIKPSPLEGEKFIEGEYVNVAIDETGVFRGVRLPLDAFYEDEVYVYSKTDSTISKKRIEVLDENQEGLFVRGLKDNQIIITQEVMNFTDSTKYDILIKEK